MIDNNFINLAEKNNWNEFFEEFKRKYLELNNLVDEYNMNFEKRKELRSQILLKSKQLDMPIEYINNNVENIKRKYRYADNKFDDYEKVINIIKLLIQSDMEYEIKNINFDGYLKYSKYGESEFELVNCNLMILSDIDTLNNINTLNNYDDDQIKCILQKLINDGKSFVVGTNYHDRILTNFKNVVKTKILESYSIDIYCYLNDDKNLEKAISKLEKYTNDNGYDINGVDEDEIVSTINNYYNQNRLTLKK